MQALGYWLWLSLWPLGWLLSDRGAEFYSLAVLTKGMGASVTFWVGVEEWCEILSCYAEKIAT